MGFGLLRRPGVSTTQILLLPAPFQAAGLGVGFHQIAHADLLTKRSERASMKSLKEIEIISSFQELGSPEKYGQLSLNYPV